MIQPEINDLVYIIAIHIQYPKDLFLYKYAKIVKIYYKNNYSNDIIEYRCKIIEKYVSSDIFLLRNQFVLLDQTIEG